MNYVCDQVLEGVPIDEAKRDPESHIVGGRWVLCNKQDDLDPKCRGRYVAQEVNQRGKSMKRSMHQRPPPMGGKEGSVQPLGPGAAQRWTSPKVALP